MRIVFVHGACVRDGWWWWHRAGELLDQNRVTSVAPLLPSCGEAGLAAGVGGPGLVDDVEAVRHVLLASNEPTIVVAHSYGGIVAAEAAADVSSIRHLVLVSSYLPTVGESLADFGSGEPAPFLDVDGAAGTFGVHEELLEETFLHDCDRTIRLQAPDHMARQSAHVVAQTVSATAWQQVATTYVVCAHDRGTPASLQREYSRRADRVAEMEAGHHPFLSQPAAFCDLILALAGE